jgi:hypothetical protein
MSRDGELEKRLSDAITQWEEATQTIKYCVYALGFLNRPSLWLTEYDKTFLRELDSAFPPLTREETNEP